MGDHAHRTVEKLADGQFPPGPKIQAAVEFVEQGGERAVVCRPEGVVEALEGRGDCGQDVEIKTINLLSTGMRVLQSVILYPLQKVWSNAILM